MSLNEGKTKEEISNNECSIFNIQVFSDFSNSVLEIGYSGFLTLSW